VGEPTSSCRLILSVNFIQPSAIGTPDAATLVEASQSAKLKQFNPVGTFVKEKGIKVYENFAVRIW
jgi:hypothetical protein